MAPWKPPFILFLVERFEGFLICPSSRTRRHIALAPNIVVIRFRVRKRTNRASCDAKDPSTIEPSLHDDDGRRSQFSSAASAKEKTMIKRLFRVVTDGLRFPEGLISASDGTIVLSEIATGRILRISPDGKKEVIAEPGGGPNGLAYGPDGWIYCCNGGGFAGRKRMVFYFRRG